MVADGMIYVGCTTGRADAFDGCFVDPNLPVASTAEASAPLASSVDT